MMPRATSRRFLAIGAAVVAVVVGNFVRISSSVVVGLYAGRSSLVLFHDWVGSMIGFAFTLGGFILMLWILLPARAEAPVPSLVTEGAA
jgi:carbamoyl-phosphate synthase large subunit